MTTRSDLAWGVAHLAVGLGMTVAGMVWSARADSVVDRWCFLALAAIVFAATAAGPARMVFDRLRAGRLMEKAGAAMRAERAFVARVAPADPEVVSIAYRRLVSRPGYEHEAIEMTANVRPGDDWERTYEWLRRQVAAKLAEKDEVLELQHKADQLRADADYEERRLERLKGDLDRLRQFAVKLGVDPDRIDIPF